jgi:hypothetical protein
MEDTDDQSLPPPRPQRCVRRQTLFFFLVKSDDLPSQAQDQCKMTLKNGGFRFVSFRFVSFLQAASAAALRTEKNRWKAER